jgi:hypothetical protein
MLKQIRFDDISDSKLLHDEPKNRTFAFFGEKFSIFFKNFYKGYFHAIFEKNFENFLLKNTKVRFFGSLCR